MSKIKGLKNRHLWADGASICACWTGTDTLYWLQWDGCAPCCGGETLIWQGDGGGGSFAGLAFDFQGALV